MIVAASAAGDITIQAHDAASATTNFTFVLISISTSCEYSFRDFPVHPADANGGTESSTFPVRRNARPKQQKSDD
jgi:hypothetical protein